MSLSLLTFPSTNPLFWGSVRPATTAALSRSILTTKPCNSRIWLALTRLLPSVELFAGARAQHLGKLLNEVVGQIDFWMKLPKRDERFLFICLQFSRPTEEEERRLPRGQRRWREVASFCGVLLPFWRASEQAAQTPTHTIGCNHGPPVLDRTGLYYGNQLPTVRGERAGVNQDRSDAAEMVVRETRHGPTSARPWHGLSQPGQQWSSARSRASVRSRRAGSERGAPLASPASAVLPLGSISATVWVAPFPEVWLLTAQSGGSDERPDDVPVLPPEPHRGF